MKFFLPALLILILFSSCSTLQQPHYIKFVETRQNTVKKQIKNIMIIGMGKLPTRFFLEQITGRLMVDFEKKGINVAYHYLGNDLKKAEKQFDNLSGLNSFDAVMTIFESDFAEVRQLKDDIYLFGSTEGITVEHLRFNQGFNIRLYEPANLTQYFWGSAINMDYDFRNPVLYQTISNKMMASLQKNNLCE